MNSIEEKFRKLAPVDRSVDALWLLYLSGEAEERVQTEELLDILLHQKARKDFRNRILLDPCKADKCAGEYKLGTVIYPDRSYTSFGLRENEWLKHMLITGMTGTGKTNLCFQILRQFKKHGKPFLVFDWKKNYRDLIQLDEFKDTEVYTIGNKLKPYYFNPLIPPDKTDPGIWLVRLVDVAKHAFFLGEGVEYLFRHGIDYVYQQRGIYDQPNGYPLFSDVKDFVSKQQLKGRMSLWKASTMRALASLTFPRGLGISLEHSGQTDARHLLNTNIVMELDAMSNSDKIFFTEALVLWIYEYRKNEGKRERFKHAIVIEEGHHILSGAKERREGQETIIETSLRQIREFGESVIVIDQEPSKLSDSIKANTFCKVTFNLGNGKDIADIARCMMLDDEETRYIDLLNVGHGIVKLKERVHKPMLLIIPAVSIKKGIVTDDVLTGKKTL